MDGNVQVPGGERNANCGLLLDAHNNEDYLRVLRECILRKDPPRVTRSQSSTVVHLAVGEQGHVEV